MDLVGLMTPYKKRTSGSTIESIKTDFSEEERTYHIAKSCTEKPSVEVFRDLTSLLKNTRLFMSKDVMPSTLLTFRKLPELETTMCQLRTGKHFLRCQYHSFTSLEKILTTLIGHSLMSWLVSASKL
ncbi:putative ribonuclease 11 [Rhynchocyon petersi]